jgi:FkbM family methyltransferase
MVKPGLSLIQRIKVVARRMGIELTRFDPSSTDDARRMRILARHGITLTLDVGANVGQYAQQLRMSGFKGRIVSFEPLPESFAQLTLNAASDENWECLHVALGVSDHLAEIGVGEASVTSSLLPVEPQLASIPGWRRTGIEKIHVMPLDAIAPTLIASNDKTFLKLDVQGYELLVLQGARETIPHVDVVETEMLLFPHYIGQPSYREVIEFLHEAGFTLASVEPGYIDSASGYVTWMDGIFVRTPNHDEVDPII